jgi:hypothetical protein
MIGAWRLERYSEVVKWSVIITHDQCAGAPHAGTARIAQDAPRGGRRLAQSALDGLGAGGVTCCVDGHTLPERFPNGGD